MTPDELFEIIEALPQTPDWDTYGGLPTSPHAKRNALLLGQLLSLTPSIGPLPSGAIDWHYQDGRTALTLIIGADGGLRADLWIDEDA